MGSRPAESGGRDGPRLFGFFMMVHRAGGRGERSGRRLGTAPAGVGVDRLGVGAQLQGREPQDLSVDLQGRLVWESVEHTHEGDLVRLRVSTPQQDVSSQRLAILEYARTHDIRIDDFIEATASGQASERSAGGSTS